jgi:hypothetical protein
LSACCLSSVVQISHSLASSILPATVHCSTRWSCGSVAA